MTSVADLDAAGAPTRPKREPVKAKLSRDDWLMRGFMLVIGLYLLIALAFPLFAMLSKSFEVYEFRLQHVEVALWQDGGWAPAETLQDYAERMEGPVNGGLVPSERTRVQALELIPKSLRETTERYRFRDLSPDKEMLLYDGVLSQDESWLEVEADMLRRVLVRPVSYFSGSNYLRYFSTPTLRESIFNSLLISTITTLIVVPLAFFFAYALTRSRMPMKGLFKTVAMMPILVPSILPGIALIYLFGKQGIINWLLFGADIYGPIGIVMAASFFTFPHAFIIVLVALSISDARLYEASTVLRASKWRTFWTVTIPGARYGLISAAFVVFTLTITDFGSVKVIGGQFNVLALDIYKQVVGQQNFQMGAVVSMVLLIPAVIAFAVDRQAQKRQVALLSARAVPFDPKPERRFDYAMLGYCSLIAVFIVGILAICQYAAFVKLWPYNHTMVLENYDFNRMDGGGWSSYSNSIVLSLATAVIGTLIVFTGAYMVEKGRGFQNGRSVFQLLAMMPMAIPGMVLGLAYVFFFNNPDNPLNFIYGTMIILVVSTVTHFYTVAHLTAVTALKQMDNEFEAVSSSLKQPFYRMFHKVTVPVCLPAILDISIYLFVNAMTTVSAVVFLYSPSTQLASIAALNMEDAGDTAPAAAMCMMIFYVNVFVRLLHAGATRGLYKSTQAWRMR